MFIRIEDEELSDGSMVHNVNIGNCLRLNAISYNDAKELAAKIAEAIETHTVNIVESDH